MALVHEMSGQGRWLFRWRSYLPIILISILAMSFVGLHWPWGSYKIHEAWELICIAISFFGVSIRCATVGFVPAGTSGRNTRSQCASSLNTTGVYSIVRHPLYVGNYFVGLGVSLVLFNWWTPLVYTLAFWLYYERIMMAEESFLDDQFGAEFRDWAATTPAIIPRWSLWRPPCLPFSIRSVLRREYSTVMLVVGLHAGIEVSEHIWLEGRPTLDLDWSIIIVATVAMYLILLTLKKRTNLLTVAGR